MLFIVGAIMMFVSIIILNYEKMSSHQNRMSVSPKNTPPLPNSRGDQKSKDDYNQWLENSNTYKRLENDARNEVIKVINEISSLPDARLYMDSLNNPKIELDILIVVVPNVLSIHKQFFQMAKITLDVEKMTPIYFANYFWDHICNACGPSVCYGYQSRLFTRDELFEKKKEGCDWFVSAIEGDVMLYSSHKHISQKPEAKYCMVRDFDGKYSMSLEDLAMKARNNIIDLKIKYEDSGCVFYDNFLTYNPTYRLQHLNNTIYHNM